VNTTADAASAEWVGEQVRLARIGAGMTQQELARAVDMPQPSIARIERGTVNPRTSTLIAILRATGNRLAIEPTNAR
jgi:predicted transcriptional regulator